MKRVLSVLLAAVLCVGMLTGCGEKKDAGEVESVDFDESSSISVQIKDMKFQVPSNWNESTIESFGEEEQVRCFKSDDVYLKVLYNKNDIDKLDDDAYKSHITEITGSLYPFAIKRIYDESYGDIKAKVADISFYENERHYVGHVFTLELGDFIFGIDEKSEKNYERDMELILQSAKIVNVKSILEELKDAGIPIEYDIIYTDETDPNGPNHEYIEKGNFADSRIEEEYSKEEPLSGTIEIFDSRDAAVARVDYLESLDILSLDSFAYRIVSENVLLRLNDKYSEEEIQEFADILNGEIRSKAKSDYEDLTEELENPSAIQTGYQTGMYKIGTDMPAGEYLITSSGGYYAVTADSSGSLESIISNDNYRNRAYVTVQDGQYFQFDGTAVPVSEAAAFTPVNGTYPDGMYLVGKDIPAGEYKVSATNGGYYEVTANSTGDLGTIISNDNFDGEVYLTVQDGQYLKLSRSQIVVQ